MDFLRIWRYKTSRRWQTISSSIAAYRINKSIEALNNRRVKNRIILIMGLTVLLSNSYAWLAYLVLIKFENNWNITLLDINFSGHYRHWDQERRTPIILDRTGTLVGLYPTSLEASFQENNRTRKDYRTAPVHDLPPLWWKMVIAIEDANQGKWYHHDGIDYSIFPKKLLGMNSGGSTIVMQLVKSMNSDADTGKGTLGSLRRFVRKTRDILHAPALNYFLNNSSPKALAEWYANHVPLLFSSSRGLVAASYAVFNVPPAQLSVAQQAILASAIKYNIGYAGIGDKQLSRAETILLKMLNAEIISKPSYEEAVAELEAMPKNLAIKQDALYSCLKTRKSTINKRLLNLELRSAIVARGELIEARSELVDKYGSEWRKHISEFQLTTDQRVNCQLKQEIFKIAKPLIEKIDHDPFIDLSVANGDGEIIAYFGNSYDPQYHGFNTGAKSTKYDPNQEAKKIGSIGKVLASIIAGIEGDDPQTRYFMEPRNKIIGTSSTFIEIPFINSNGYAGSDDRDNVNSRGWISAIDAFGQSNNLAVMDRLQHSSILDMAPQMIDDFGFSRKNNPDQVPNYAIDVPMGNIYGSGRTIHTMMRAISLHLNNQATNGNCAPSIIKNIVLSSSNSGSPDAPEETYLTNICKRTQRYLTDEHTRYFVKNVLSSVVDRAHRGTASTWLGDWSPLENKNIIWHIAKTGTTSHRARLSAASTPGTNRAMVTGAFNFNGQVFSYFVQMAPGANHTSLGAHVYGGNTALLLRPVMQNIVRNRYLHVQKAQTDAINRMDSDGS